MTGRPSSFTQEIADEICERLMRGESLRTICGAERDDFIPGQTTVFKWLSENEAFAKQYVRARELQAEHFVDEIIAIADSPNTTVNPVTREPELRDPQRDRLRVDARKWVASKLAPKKYGDKIALTGADGGPVQFERIERRIVDPKVSEIPGLSRPSEAKSPNTVD